MFTPKTTPLLTALAKYFGCDEASLQEKLNHPLTYEKANDFIRGKQLRTSYLDNNGMQKDIKGNETRIGLKSAREQHAYEGFLGITVEVSFEIF